MLVCKLKVELWEFQSENDIPKIKYPGLCS
jgi:hypothetical protein